MGIFFYFILPAFFGFDFVLDVVLARLPRIIRKPLAFAFKVMEKVLKRFLIQLLTLLVDKTDENVVMACLNEFLEERR